VPLRDISALEEWRQRDNPPEAVWTAVRTWVGGLDHAPWQAPSTPFAELSGQPDYEVRSAVVPGSGEIEVFYRQDYVTDDVDLIWVGRTGR